MTAKEFTFEPGLSETRQVKRKDLKVKMEKLQKELMDTCEVCFSDAFELYIHAKVLRLIIEANMRFGKDGTVFYAVDYVSGKEKYIQNELIDIFGDKQAQGNWYLIQGSTVRRTKSMIPRISSHSFISRC